MVRLSMGPIDVTLLKNYFEPKNLIQNSSFDVDHIFLEYKGVQEPFVLELDHFTVFDGDHIPFFKIPSLILSLDYSALLKGKIRLKSVRLHAPQLTINMQNPAVELEKIPQTEEYLSYGILGAFFGVGSQETQMEIQKILKYLDEIFLEEGSLKVVKDDAEILAVSKFNIHLKPTDYSENSYIFRVEAEGVSFFFPDLDRRTFEIPEMILQGQVYPAQRKTEFEISPFEWQGSVARVHGTFSTLEMSLIKLSMTSTPIALVNFPNVWPEGLATTTRNWILKNLSKGGIDKIGLDLELEIPKVNQGETFAVKLKNLTGRFDLKDVMVDYITGLPLAEVVLGIARFNMDQFDIEIVQGHLQDIQVTGGLIHFFDLSTDVEKAKIDLFLKGPLTNILKVIDHAPLKYAEKLGIKPEDFQGNALIRLDLTFPLLVKLELDQIDILTKAQLQDVSYIHDLGRDDQKNMEIQGGGFDLIVDKNHLKLTGEALVEGSKSILSWIENFKEDNLFSREMTCVGIFPVATFSNFGIPLEKFVKGMVNLNLLMQEKNKKHMKVIATGDLKESELNFSMLGVHKKVGETASISCVLDVMQNQPWTISKILFRSPLMQFSGNIVLDQKNKEIKTMDFSTVKAPKTDMRMRLSKTRLDTYDLKIWGKSLDASWFFKEKNGDDHQTKNGETPNFRLDLNLDCLWTRGDAFLKSVKLLLNRKHNRYVNIECEGILKSGDKLTVIFKPRFPNPGFIFFLKANNAGDFFRLVNGYDDLKGGVLTIEGMRSSDDPKELLVGHAKLDDFRLMKAPVLAKILSLASVGGIADFLSDNGLYFDKGTLEFKANDDVIEIQKGLAESSATGITGAGFIDRQHKTLSLKGNVIPVYLLNSLIGKIPILGSILSGGEDKGFLAATYEVTGEYDNPKVSVNPLSILTPGFLRELF